MPRGRGVLLAVLVAVMAIGCGSSGTTSDGASTTTPPSREELVSAVTGALTALLSGDSLTSYQSLSVECQAKYTVAEWGVQITMAKSFVAGFTGVEMDDLRVGKVEVVEIGPQRALVKTSSLLADGTVFDEDDEPKEWVFQEGRWRSPDCESFEESFSGGSTTTTVGREVGRTGG